jgi:hypothetical protein
LPALLTWRLWRALRYPDEIHPLFQRVQAQPLDIPGRKVVRALSPLYEATAFLLSVVLFVVAPLALVLVANLFGAVVAYNVMSAIQRELDQRTYDLLALTPMGLGRANWLIAAACAHRLDVVDRLASLRSLALIMLLLLIFYLSRSGIFPALTLLIAFVALNLDAIQSLIIGCLSGMLAQVFREQGAPFAALAIFAFTQIIAVYLPMTGLAILVFNLLRRTLSDNWIGNTLIALLMLGLMFLLREAILQGMWRALERRLL